MGIPEPKVALDDACSTIYNNTLYSYSSKAFQSLSIEQGAEWEELDSGVSVTGGICVHATPQDDTTVEALYVVGGTSSDSTYPGLQRYIFAESKWETVTPASTVTKNRLYHAAVYLNSSQTILVYAGTQDGSQQDSSQTFTISTGDAHDVVSYISNAPPTISPLLLPWTNSSAIVIGGSDTNTDVKVFTLVSSWIDSNITLASPLTKNSSMVQAIVIDGDDGSKSLYTFDMSVSPNEVNRTVLLGAGGDPIANAQTVFRRTKKRDRHSERETKRDDSGKFLTVSDWPSYNSTLAPTSTRTGYSIAKDANGLVVLSGGSTDDDSICMFSATDNAWLNATSELTDATKTQVPLTSSSSSASATSTTSAESSNAAAATDASSKSDLTKVLAAVLGSVIGAALLLCLLLFFLRWRRKRREHAELGHQRRASGHPNDEKAIEVHHNYDTSFLDLDQSRSFPGHKAGKESQNSFSSMAILMGKVGQSTGHQRGGLGRNVSTASSADSSMFNKKYKNAISNPIPQEGGLGAMNGGLPGALVKEVSFENAATGPPPAASRARASNSAARRGSTRRSSGWNRYWSGGSMNILGLGSKRNTCSSGSDRSSNSQYSSDQRRPSQTRQLSVLVPPLSTPAKGNLGLSRVMTGSPTISHPSGNFPFREGVSGEIGHSRPGSASSVDSYEAHPDAFSSGVPESVTEFGAALSSWDTPMAANAHPRAPSSTYSSSNYDRTTMGTQFGGFGGIPSAVPGMSTFPAPPSRPPAAGASSAYGSDGQWQQGHQHINSDMSWLNLGADTTRGPGSRI